MTAYDPANIFGKIIRGEISAHKVYEDADVLVMMDIFPQSTRWSSRRHGRVTYSMPIRQWWPV